jgi:hypothetical protein
LICQRTSCVKIWVTVASPAIVAAIIPTTLVWMKRGIAETQRQTSVDELSDTSMTHRDGMSRRTNHANGGQYPHYVRDYELRVEGRAYVDGGAHIEAGCRSTSSEEQAGEGRKGTEETHTESERASRAGVLVSPKGP